MNLFRTNKLFFGIIFFYSFKSLLSGSEKDNLSVNLPKDRNQSLVKNEVIRVVQPGVFDYQSNEYVVRLRLWELDFQNEINQVLMMQFPLQSDCYWVFQLIFP